MDIKKCDMSIEERAKKASEGYEDDGYSAGLYMGYVVGATAQKAIDIENACKACENELRRLKTLLNKMGVSSSLISIGQSLSNIMREMHEND